jgi:HD-GYP domain-containing protein (c-di-GMP phosphodiesterase class II)
MAAMIIGQIVSLACGLWVSAQFAQSSFDDERTEAPVAVLKGTGDPVAAVETTASPTFLQLLIGRTLTLIWIGGLQAGVAYLVIANLRKETSKGHTESELRILHREKDLVRTRNAVVCGLAKLAEYRDRETGHHLERIALYATCLASALRNEPRYRDLVSPAFVKQIGISSALHDIGKVAIADSILRKPMALDPDEREQMQEHVVVGAKCIREIEQRLGTCNFLAMAYDIAQGHHETWEGQGYPRGIGREKIPLAARIVAIADVYDALASKRVYKEAYVHQKCVEMIVEASGTQFDPGIVDVFVRTAPQFQRIAQRFCDGSKELSGSASQHTQSIYGTDPLIKSLLEQGEPTSEFAATP